jgi:uncharacterized protein
VRRFAAGAAVIKIASEAANPEAPKLSQFAYADVQLLDGPMLEQFRNNVSYF